MHTSYSLAIILILVIVLTIFSTAFHNISYASTQRSPCNCVVFRLDDVQDDWIDNSQLSVMNMFISKNQPLSLGLIMNSVGQDADIVEKLSDGKKKGLFELSLHGWKHVDYTSLSLQEQEYALKLANEKMEKLFGTPSDVFIPPYNAFNSDTLDALNDLGIKMLSAGLDYDNSPYNTLYPNYNNDHRSATIYHLPETVEFKMYEDEHANWIKTPVEAIIKGAENDISIRGYSVIMTHVQDYALSEDGQFVDKLSQQDLDDLGYLIDYFTLKSIKIATFAQIAGFGNCGDNIEDSNNGSSNPSSLDRIYEYALSVTNKQNETVMHTVPTDSVFISAKISNSSNEKAKCLIVLQILDPEGFAIFIGWKEVALEEGEVTDVGWSLISDKPGDYIASSFIINNNLEAPEMISSKISKKFVVLENLTI